MTNSQLDALMDSINDLKSAIEILTKTITQQEINRLKAENEKIQMELNLREALKRL